MEQRFSGQTVIITGASSGIGEGCARRFSAEGANVVIAARGRERLEAVAEAMDSARTLAIVADVSKADDVQALVQAAVDRFGQLNVLVSNAGTAVPKSFEETTLEDWRMTMAVDVDSCFHGAKVAVSCHSRGFLPESSHQSVRPERSRRAGASASTTLSTNGSGLL